MKKLNVKAFALTGGILWAAAVFALTWWLFWMGGRIADPSVIGRPYYLGYEISAIGSAVGAAYGFLEGSVISAVFAFIYNLFS